MSFNPEYLLDYLPVYYRRIYPYKQVFRWLSSDDDSMNRREVSFTLFGDIYLRYQSFDTINEFISELQKRTPVKIDIGAIYSKNIKYARHSADCQPMEKEIVFDIDMTDYDEIRTCCTGADICVKCWKFMVIACKILDAALTEDFGFKHLLWVFSGRRGIHCWVCDPRAKLANNQSRLAIVDYLNVVSSGQRRKSMLPTEKIHPSISRALKIIDKYFLDVIINDQNVLATDAGLKKFLGFIDVSIRNHFDEVMTKQETSQERWTAFVQTFDLLNQKQQIPRHWRNLKEELKLIYSYPRLDVNVSNDIKHLLKAPFCIHPVSGKVSVPFSSKIVDRFDPFNVPTIHLLIEEINKYDAITKEQEQEAMNANADDKIFSRIKDYKKTSLLKPVNVFEEFLKHLDSEKKSGNMLEF